MQTQLASQLQKIRLDTADVADYSSILFSPKDGAKINLQSIYSMARNGIMELSRIDSRFSRFEESLFGSKLLSMNRLHITSKENGEIDELIRDYLYSVSPFLLLKCAQKTLEYLIRRFSIHTFNAEDFFLAILPYHESPLFPRVYRILDMKSHLFDFLNNVKKNETPIVRSTLSTQCLKDVGFLNFVLDSYRRLNEHHVIPVQHLTLLCAMVVDFSRNGSLKEEYVRALVSFASLGLSSTNSEFQASGLLILSQVAINVTLSNEVITACLNNCLRVENINMNQLVECILILFRNNRDYLLPLESAKLFLQNETLQASLQNLARKASIIPIVTALVDAHVSILISSDQYIPLLRLLCQCIREQEVIDYLQSYLQHLSQYLNSHSLSADETSNVEKVLLVLSSEFSGPFDNLLSAIPTDDPLKSISSRLFYGSTHMLLSSGRTLFLSVDSHEYSVRKEVCGLLKQQLEKVDESTAENDRQFIRNSMVSLLEDDFMDITLEVFMTPLELLLRVFSEKEVLEMILGVIRHDKIINNTSDESVKSVVEVAFLLLRKLPLETIFAEKPVATICLLYQYLLEGEKPIKKVTLEVMAGCNSPFTKGLNASFAKLDQEKQVKKVASGLLQSFKKGDDTLYETCHQLLATSHSVAVFFIYVLLSLIRDNKKVEDSKKIASLLCDFAVSVLGKLEPSEAALLQIKEQDIKTLPSAVKSTKDYISLLLHTMFICSTLLPWDISDLTNQFDAILTYSAHPMTVICFCFRTFVPQKSFIMLLANLVCNAVWAEKCDVYLSLLACSDESNVILHSLNKLLNFVTQQKVISNNEFNSILLSVIHHLGNPVLAVRSTVFMLLDTLRSHVSHEEALPAVSTGMGPAIPNEGQVQSILLQFVNYLLSIRSEVQDDVNFFSIRLNVLFTSAKPRMDPSSLSSAMLPLILSVKSLHQRVGYLRLFEKMPYHPAAENEVLQWCQETFHIFEKAEDVVSTLLVDQWHYLMPLFFAAMAQTFTHQQEFRSALYGFMSTPLTVESANGRITPLTDVLRSVNKDIFAVMNTPEKLSLLRALFTVIPNHPNVDAVDVYNSINELDLSTALLSEEVKSLTEPKLDDSQAVKLMTVFVEVVTRNEKLSTDAQIIDPLLTILNRLIDIAKRHSQTRESVSMETKRAQEGAMEVESAFSADSHVIMSDMLSIFYPIQILLECLYSVVRNTTNDVLVTSEQTLKSADPSQPPTKRIRRNSISISREVAVPPQVIVDLINLNLTTQINKTCLQLLTVLASVHSEEMDRHLFTCFDALATKVIQNQDEDAFNVVISVLTYCLPQFTNQEQLLRIYKTFLSCVLYIPYSQSIQLLNTLIDHSSMRYIGHITAYLLLINNGFEVHNSLEHLGKMDEEAETPTRIENSVVASSSINHFISSMFLGLGLLPQIQALSVLCNFTEIITEHEQREEEKGSRMRELTQGLVRSIPTALLQDDELNPIRIGQLILNFVRDIVSSSSFISSVASTDKDMDKIQQFFIHIIENLLMVLQNESTSRDLIGVQSRGRQKTESEMEAIHGYRELEGCVYDCITVFAEVMTVSSLLTVLSVLLKHEDSGIRKRALVMLNKKIHDNIEILDDEEKTDFLDFIDNLLEIINDEQEQSANKQTALLSLHILIQYFGSENPEAFQNAVLSIVSIVTQTGVTTPSMQALKGSAYIALSVCCSQLGIRMLPYLPRFLPPLLTELEASAGRCESLQEEVAELAENGDKHRLEECQAQLDEAQVLVQSLIATLSSAVTYQGSLLSGFLKRILQIVLRPIFIASDKQVVRGAVTVLLDLLSEKIESRLLLPAVYDSFKAIDSHAACSYSGLFSVVAALFNRLEESQVGNFYERAWSFCVSGMEIRARWEDSDEVDEVEQAIVKALIAITLKLNENQLNPLFVKTVNWMQEKSMVQNEPSENELPDPSKAIPFFSLVAELSSTLKSIFTSYFGQFFSTMTDLLAAFNKSCRKEKEVSQERLISYKLIKLVVLSLYRCFLYDSDGWMDETKFKLVSSPLAKCLGAYFIPNYEQEYPKFMNSFVVPTLIQLVVSTSGHDDWWQQFNHEVLIQTRSPMKDVKLAAIRVIRECFERMSQEYLPLLPDVIPFLADLLEDEDAQVEKAAQDLRVQLESISGEELTNYLTI